MNEKLTYAVLFAVVLLIIALLAWIIHLMKGKSSAKKTGPSRSDAAVQHALTQRTESGNKSVPPHDRFRSAVHHKRLPALLSAP